MEQYVQEAYKRLEGSKSPKFTDCLHKFICDCAGLIPARYGPLIQNKVIRDLNAIGVKSDQERGDFRKNKTYFEFKSSFLSKGHLYSITNIRDWHKFDYYVLCFINVQNNFTPNFYVIKKDDVKKLKLRGMNGTAESNEVNTNVGMRVTLDINSKDFELFESMNLLKDKSFESLNEFIDSFKPKRSEPEVCKFKFNGVEFNSDNFTENYINFLEYFIQINNEFRNVGITITARSLGRFFAYNIDKLPTSSVKKKRYVKIFNLFYVSTYSSTEQKINHIKKICEFFPYEVRLELFKKENEIITKKNFFEELFSKIKRKVGYGFIWWEKEGKEVFQYCNRHFLVDYDFYDEIVEKFKIGEIEVNNLLLNYFEKKYPNIKPFGVIGYNVPMG